MSNNHLTLTLTIISDQDSEELAKATQYLRKELLELQIEDVNFVKNGGAPDGAKAGDIISWGQLLVTLVASNGLVTAVVSLLQSWLARNNHRSVTLELDGDKLLITGITSQEQKQLVNEWIKRHPIISLSK